MYKKKLVANIEKCLNECYLFLIQKNIFNWAIKNVSHTKYFEKYILLKPADSIKACFLIPELFM